MIAWPQDVPQFAAIGSFSEQPERNVSEFSPESGPPLSRRRSSIATLMVAFETVMARTAFNVLLDWYRNDLKDGSLPFRRNHPGDLNGQEIYCMFTEPPKFSDAGYYLHGRVTLSLRILP